MFIYNPKNIITKRIKEAEEILENLPYKYCFITGSFLFKEKYKELGVTSIAFPKLGCQQGGLKWNEVKPLMLPELPRLKKRQQVHHKT